jgi:proteasome lid subunit RPN8/RPN11
MQYDLITKISSSAEAIQYCRNHFRRLIMDALQEEFHIITLDTKNQILRPHQITVGTLDASLVHPREVFRPAIKDAASSILMVHNHPSGDATPSREDIAVTDRLVSTFSTISYWAKKVARVFENIAKPPRNRVAFTQVLHKISNCEHHAEESLDKIFSKHARLQRKSNFISDPAR